MAPKQCKDCSCIVEDEPARDAYDEFGFVLCERCTKKYLNSSEGIGRGSQAEPSANQEEPETPANVPETPKEDKPVDKPARVPARTPT